MATSPEDLGCRFSHVITRRNWPFSPFCTLVFGGWYLVLCRVSQGIVKRGTSTILLSNCALASFESCDAYHVFKGRTSSTALPSPFFPPPALHVESLWSQVCSAFDVGCYIVNVAVSVGKRACGFWQCLDYNSAMDSWALRIESSLHLPIHDIEMLNHSDKHVSISVRAVLGNHTRQRRGI